MNKICISGRLTRDPEMTTVSNGMEKCRFSVAVDRRKGKDGEKKVDFFDCAAWNKTGAFIEQWFHKGDGIEVIGRMESNRVEKDDGTKAVYWTLNVDEVEFPKGKAGNADGQAPAPAAAPAPEKVDEQSGFTAVETDELPF